MARGAIGLEYLRFIHCRVRYSNSNRRHARGTRSIVLIVDPHEYITLTCFGTALARAKG